MASNPFITQANPMMGQTLIDPESLALQRQKQYAAALMQQNQQPQGQMVSGQFVAPSWTQQLNSALNPILGSYMLSQADTKQTQLAEALRQRGIQESQDILSTVRGKQATPEVVPQGQTLLDDQGMITMGSQRGVAGVAPDLQSAYAQSAGAMTPQGRALAPMLAKQLMREPKFEKIEQYDPKTGNTMVGMIDVNSPNPEATYRPVGVSKPALTQKDIIDFRDRGINVGGGMPSSGVPMVGGQGAGQVTGDAKFMPATLPVYQPDPTLSPQQNRELQGQFAKDIQKNVKNAKDAFGSIKAVAEILRTNDPSSGLAENIITGTREIFGGGGKQSQADAKLKVLGQKLVQQVPRFEGPQSDKDVASYQAAAGDIGNPNRPIGARLAALQTLVDLNKKYYPNGDWDSINLETPTIKPNMLGGKSTYFGATVAPQGSAKPNLVYDPATGTFR
jgi:hypothetical protein